MEWPLRILLMLGGLVLAMPGGGVMPVSHEQMAWLTAVLLAPTLVAAYWLTRSARRVAI
jgi:hypothetical protein